MRHHMFQPEIFRAHVAPLPAAGAGRHGNLCKAIRRASPPSPPRERHAA